MHRLRALFLILFLIGIGGMPVYAQPTPPPTATPVPITFTIWHSWQNKEAQLLADWVSKYQEENPHVTIETRQFHSINLLDEVLDAIKRDQGPDLFIGPSSWAWQLAEDRRVAPLNERLDKEFRDQVSGKAWDTVKINDFLYGVPESLYTVTMFYNADLVSADKLPKTLEELNATNPAMMLDFSITGGMYFGLGGTLVNAKGEIILANENVVFQNYLSMVQDSFNKMKAANALFTRDRIPVSTDRRFRDGQTPILIDGNWKADDLLSDMKDRVRVSTLPTISNGKPWTPMLTSQVFYLNVNANQSDGAVRFLKYVTGVAGQSRAAKIAGRIPVNLKAEAGRYTQALWTQAEGSVVLSPVNPQALSRLWQALDQAVFGVTVQGGGVSTAIQGAIAVVNAK